MLTLMEYLGVKESGRIGQIGIKERKCIGFCWYLYLFVFANISKDDTLQTQDLVIWGC